ncbi:MAG: uroporphyrinogen-III synthase [Flavobacteriaceae bacterium]|jgi:uroporphyrinogen-III synthase|nr:uroporphyrinogen-III synthase [Flavobacteriaceae bacterium]
MSNLVTILSTKVLSPSQRETLENNYFSVIEEDFIATKNQNFELTEINSNLIFTSQNAAQSVLLHPKCQELKSKNIFCVGIKTKALLEENGFNVIVYVDYAADLAEIITLIYANESYTFFSGNLRKETLPKALKEAKIKFNEIQVYETSLTPKKVKVAVEAILFFSPSGVESYLKKNTIKKELCFCIGETTADALPKTVKNIIIAAQPSIEDVIEECIEEYK